MPSPKITRPLQGFIAAASRYVPCRTSMWAKWGMLALLCAAAAFTSSAQTFTTLVSFDDYNGMTPLYVSLVQGRDGNFYGTTEAGGVRYRIMEAQYSR
jgi:hypothetical protein